MANDRPLPVGSMDGEKRWQKDIWIPEVDRSYRMRQDAIRREVSLEEGAAGEGERNLPNAADKGLNELQQDICNRVFSGILMLNQFLEQQLAEATKLVRDLKPPAINLKDMQSRVSAAVEAEFNDNRGALKELKVTDLAAQRSLRHFRVLNGLNRAASYSETSFKPIAMIFFLIVMESIANGFLLQQISAEGLVGGAGVAMVISFVNIALGVLAGLWGWRYMAHVKPVSKFRGVLITVIFHGAAFGWNLWVAHFREVAEIAASGPGYDFNIGVLALQTLPHIRDAGLFGFSSIFSWGLLALGLLLHFLAAREGYEDIADRYPDYRAYDKRARDARETFDNTFVGLRVGATEAASDVVRAAEIVYARSRHRADLISSLVDLAGQRRREVQDSEDEWVAGGSALLKAYRDINSEVRDTKPPAYFAVFPSAQDYRRRTFVTGKESTEVDAHTKGVERSMTELERHRDEAEQTVDANADALNALREWTNEKLASLAERLGALRDSITAEAARDIEQQYPVEPDSLREPATESARPAA
jgi:hypothetical protein